MYSSEVNEKLSPLYLAEELKKLLQTSDIKDMLASDDIERLMWIVLYMPINRDELDSRVDAHMNLELELAWYTSRFQEMKEEVKLVVDQIRAEVFNEAYKSTQYPEWAMKELANLNPRYIEASKRLIRVSSLYTLVDRLQGAMRRRESMANNLCRHRSDY